MGFCTSTDRALSSRLRPADTVERTCSVDKLPSSSSLASSWPPSLVTESTTPMPIKLMLTTSTPPVSSCGISAIVSARLPPLSGRESTAVRVLPPCSARRSARRRLDTRLQLGETAWQATSSLAAVALASSPSPTT
jgi:hypothetical protein